MRFTVKAKLATAFGAVIALSMLTGGVAYLKLGQLADASQTLTTRAQRIDKAGELRADILYQIRAEKNMVLASTNEEMKRWDEEIHKYRAQALGHRDELVAGLDDAGKMMVAKFSASFEKVNKLEDEVIRLA